MKKSISVILIFLLCLSLAVAVQAGTEKDGVNVNIDGEVIEFDVEPQILNGRTMVPMRKIFEYLGAEVTWLDYSRSIIAECGYLKVRMQIDNTEMKIGDKVILLDVAPIIDNGRTLVPLRAVAEAFSATVDWIGKTKTVNITTKYPKNSYILSNEEFNGKQIRTASGDYEYLLLTIEGKNLIVSGKANDGRINSIGVSFGKGLLENTVSVSKNKEFKLKINLANKNISEQTDINIFTRQVGDERYWSYIYGVIFVENDGSGYSFKKPLVFEHNKEFMSEWINPVGYVSTDIADEIVALSNEICENATSDYDKLLKVHDWVAENIYYDFDYLYGKSDVLSYDALGVYNSKRSVCEGYANITRALLHAQNIPCRKIIGYSLGYGSANRYWTEETANTTESNHAWVQAYVDNRWINIDPTWDSGNKYENGEYLYKGMSDHMYFDITDLFFSYNHKYLGGN